MLATGWPPGLAGNTTWPTLPPLPEKRALDDYVLWHHPRCSKSRGALALLRERGIEPRIRDYLERPPDAGELRELLRRLDLPIRELLREGEHEYADLHLDDPSLDEDALLAAMATHPRLIQRPILIAGGRGLIARPPERVLELLQGDRL